MPEEQAFMLLCKLMEDGRYLLREMYKANFENLQVRFHQLTCLIQDNLPDLYAHFDDLKVECHMFASQWFLTLFTAKFPLYLVFRIMDIFLYEVKSQRNEEERGTFIDIPRDSIRSSAWLWPCWR